MKTIILHVDMDAFFASVEVRDEPSLRGKPLIIGSLPGERGVVSTCSYEAREYGVRSAMNIKDAYRLCPHGIYRHPNMEKYKAVSEQLHKLWASTASAVEPIALDEAYLEITEQAQNLEGARHIAHVLKQRTQTELELTCSIGVAYSKTAAKMASEEKKPNGYFEIPTEEDFINLVIDRDIQTLYTVGPKTAERLRAVGIRTIRDAQEKREAVVRLLGKHGQGIVDLAFGRDDRPVVPYRPQDAKSISRAVTFQANVADMGFLKDVLVLLAVCVERRAQRYGLYGSGVALKITYADMKVVTRSRKIPSFRSAVTLWQEAIHLLDKIEKRSVRLIGVGLYDLSCEQPQPFRPQSLFPENEEGQETERKAHLEALHRRYGLDFAGHLAQLDRGETFYKTIEYMRKHRHSS